jgi:type II secretory pathway pseudopilin PulG
LLPRASQDNGPDDPIAEETWFMRVNREHRDDGWTLVETMVVVLVISLLIAIAIPTLLGSRSRSHNRTAQADLRAALVAAKASYSANATYTCALAAATVPCPAALPQLEPALTYTTAASTTANPRVSIWTAPTALTWAAARMSRSGVCFGIRDVATGAPPTLVGTWYGQNLATCTGTYASTAARTPNKKWN